MEKHSFSGRLLYGIADDFIDLILPESYACDFYQNIPPEIPDDEPEEFISDIHIVENNTNELSVVPKQSQQLENTHSTTESPPVKISEKFDEMKADNQKIANVLEELKQQLKESDMSALLKEIRTQNALLMELITKKIDENTSLQISSDQKNDSVLKKMFNIFK
jgi:predicted nuclease with TOPRIM domain